jgi:hypothetical protein
MPSKIIPPDVSELHKLQFDYAWKWFCFHADQRVKMFNFMLIVFGVFAAGVVNALDKALPPVAIAGLCFFATVLAGIFMLLDRRNGDLVRLGKDALIYLEQKAIFGEDRIKDYHDREIDFGILWRQALEQPPSSKWGPIANRLRDARLGKHRIWLHWIGGLIAFLFFVAGLWILLRTPPPC